jgi:3-oxoacyl-[acyl-carrier protein] reductase
MQTGLGGKGVLVTGAAGGIGSAVTRAFAGEGARVAVHYRIRRARAEELAKETAGVALRADLTDENEANALVPEAASALGRLDVLVANAGMWPSEDTPLWQMSFERWRETLSVNLDAVFLGCRAFLRHVERTRSGNIVLVGSSAGVFGEAGHGDYAAAKSAVAGGLLKSLKNEIIRIAPTGRVNAVSPGWTRTEMTKDALGDDSLEPRVTRTMALRKLGHADDVARIVVALASDEISGHVTGQVVEIAGGMEGRILHEP